MGNGLILSAPNSGAGKTTITLGILHALSRRGIDVRGAKSGPDYIDPRFHEAACGQICPNLDAWAMSPDRVAGLASGDGLLIIEGAMGLFDGAPPDGKGATADLARILKLPVVLIVDAAKTAQSVAPLVAGFARHDRQVNVAAVILNNVGSPRHEAMLRRALTQVGLPILGVVYRQNGLTHPSRHLGLVQAGEHPDMNAYLTRAADAMEAEIDLDALVALGAALPAASPQPHLAPPAQKIAIAQDQAFAFAYPHLLAGWRAGGAELQFFSPLADDPAPQADLIFLPGGYPELHAARLSAAASFRASMIKATTSGTQIYGECGGYMTLGETLTDADGTCHEMLGLLALQTSFAKRKLHLGYRKVSATAGPFTGSFAAHEFHYATTTQAKGTPLFAAQDAEGNDLGKFGLINGSTCGSFAHLIEKL